MDHQGIRKRESSSCKCSACAWELTPISFGLPENPVDSYPHTKSHYVYELCPYNNHARPRRCEQVSCQNAMFELVQACAIPIKPHSCGLSCLQTKTAVFSLYRKQCMMSVALQMTKLCPKSEHTAQVKMIMVLVAKPPSPGPVVGPALRASIIGDHSFIFPPILLISKS